MKLFWGMLFLLQIVGNVLGQSTPPLIPYRGTTPREALGRRQFHSDEGGYAIYLATTKSLTEDTEIYGDIKTKAYVTYGEHCAIVDKKNKIEVSDVRKTLGLPLSAVLVAVASRTPSQTTPLNYAFKNLFFKDKNELKKYYDEYEKLSITAHTNLDVLLIFDNVVDVKLRLDDKDDGSVTSFLAASLTLEELTTYANTVFKKRVGLRDICKSDAIEPLENITVGQICQGLPKMEFSAKMKAAPEKDVDGLPPSCYYVHTGKPAVTPQEPQQEPPKPQVEPKTPQAEPRKLPILQPRETQPIPTEIKTPTRREPPVTPPEERIKIIETSNIEKQEKPAYLKLQLTEKETETTFEKFVRRLCEENKSILKMFEFKNEKEVTLSMMSIISPEETTEESLKKTSTYALASFKYFVKEKFCEPEKPEDAKKSLKKLGFRAGFPVIASVRRKVIVCIWEDKVMVAKFQVDVPDISTITNIKQIILNLQGILAKELKYVNKEKIDESKDTIFILTPNADNEIVLDFKEKKPQSDQGKQLKEEPTDPMAHFSVLYFTDDNKGIQIEESFEKSATYLDLIKYLCKKDVDHIFWKGDCEKVREPFAFIEIKGGRSRLYPASSLMGKTQRLPQNALIDVTSYENKPLADLQLDKGKIAFCKILYIRAKNIEGPVPVPSCITGAELSRFYGRMKGFESIVVTTEDLAKSNTIAKLVKDNKGVDSFVFSPTIWSPKIY